MVRQRSWDKRDNRKGATAVKMFCDGNDAKSDGGIGEGEKISDEG